MPRSTTTREDEDSIILQVEIDEGAVEQRLVELRKKSNELRTEKELLRKANREGSISSDDYAKSLTKAQLALNNTAKEIRENERVLSKNTQQQQAAAGSLTQMRAQVSLLYADYAALSKEERKNAEVGGVLKKTLGDLNKELKEEEGAVGDNRRKIGDYAGAIEQAIAGNTTWTGKLQGTVSSLKDARDNIKEYITGVKASTEGMGGAQKASVALGLGLKAIGIGLLITAITALIGFLSKMDAGMDKVEQLTAAASAAVSAFIKTLAPVGELIVNTFLHPIDAIKDFANELKHPIDLFNKIIDGSKKLADDAATNMSAAARAAYDYTKAMQDLEDQENEMIGQRAKVNRQVELALLATKDRSKTERERINLLDAAGKAEEALANKQVAIQKRRLEELRKNQKAQKDLQDDDRLAEQKAIEAYENAETERLGIQQRIQNRRSALIEQEAAEQKAAAEKAKTARKDAINEQVAGVEKQLILAKQLGKDTLAIEENLIKLRAAAELVDAKGRNARALIIAKSEADQAKLRADTLLQRQNETLETRKLGIDAELSLVQKGSLRELELRQQGLRVTADIERAAIVASEKNLVLRAAKLKAVDDKLKADLKQNQSAYNAEQLSKQQEMATLRLNTEENLADQSLANQRKYQAQRIDLEEQQALDSLKLTEVTEEQRLVKENEIRAKAVKARKELDKQVAADKRSKAKNEIDAQLAGVAEGSKAERDLKRKQYKVEEEEAVAAANGEQSAIDKVRAEFKKKQKDLDQEYGKSVVSDIIATTALATSAYSSMIEAQTQRLFAELDKQQEAALESAGANADLRGKIEEQYQRKRAKLEKEAAEKRRKIASIENLIATAQAGTSALALFAKNPVLGAITEALILLKALQNQQLIDSQTFAYGGTYISDGKGAVVRGPGSGKSDSINSRISNGESILTAKATSMFYDQLSAMNVAGGGRQFPGAGGSEVPKLNGFAYGGVQSSFETDAIVTAVIMGLKGANIAVAVTDFQRVESDMTYAQSRGNI